MELKACIAKGERGLTRQDLKVVKTQRRYLLHDLNHHKDARPDMLFAKVLKALNSHNAPVLARIFNHSLQTAQAPEDWHCAIVNLVAKSPRKTDPRQFRPIRLTSVVCKILETILKEKLTSHLSQLSLLTTRQPGFLPRRSSVTNRNNVAPATKKVRGMLFNLKRSFEALTPSIFLPL